MTTGNNNENPYAGYTPGQYSQGQQNTPAPDGAATPTYQVGNYQQGNGQPVLNGGANYGAPADYSNNYNQGYGAPVKAPGSGFALASLILGIAAIVTCWFGIGGLFGLVGLILGIVAINKLRKTPGAGKGMAITGIILGALGLVIGIVMTIFIVFVSSVAVNGMTECQSYLESNDQAAYEQCIEEWANSEFGVDATVDVNR